MTEHDARMLSFGQWWRRSLRGGYGYAQVWNVTRKSPNDIYGRQLASALAWVVAMPLGVIVIAGVLKAPLVMAAIPIAYAVQTLRIYRKVRSDRANRFVQAVLTLLAKLPETLGALRYLASAKRPSASTRS